MHCSVVSTQVVLFNPSTNCRVDGEHIVSAIMTETNCEAAETFADIMSAVIRIYQLDQLIKNVYVEQKFQELVQQVNTLREEVKEAKTHYNQSKNLLKQVEEKLAKKRVDANFVANVIKVFESPRATKQSACLSFLKLQLFLLCNFEMLYGHEPSL